MTPVGFEPTISAGERPHTQALDRAATGNGTSFIHNAVSSTDVTRADRQLIRQGVLQTCRVASEVTSSELIWKFLGIEDCKRRAP